MVMTMISLTNYFPHNLKNATATTTIDKNYKARQITVRAFYYTIGKFLRASYALVLKLKAEPIKMWILNSRKGFNDSRCSRGSSYNSERNNKIKI